MSEQQLSCIGRLAREDDGGYEDCVVDHVGSSGGAADVHLTIYRPGTRGAPNSAILRRWLITRHDAVVPLFLP